MYDSHIELSDAWYYLFYTKMEKYRDLMLIFYTVFLPSQQDSNTYGIVDQFTLQPQPLSCSSLVYLMKEALEQFSSLGTAT
jgi:hypothetical protein